MSVRTKKSDKYCCARFCVCRSAPFYTKRLSAIFSGELGIKALEKSMRNFVQYHNSEKMGFSASGLSEPKIHTDKSVRNLSSNRVWIISGEGVSPKTFYLAGVFTVNRVSSNTFDHPDFKNSAYGSGHVIGEKIILNGLSWFETLKSDMKNFKNGLSEITSGTLIAELENASAPHTL